MIENVVNYGTGVRIELSNVKIMTKGWRNFSGIPNPKSKYPSNQRYCHIQVDPADAEILQKNGVAVQFSNETDINDPEVPRYNPYFKANVTAQSLGGGRPIEAYIVRSANDYTVVPPLEIGRLDGLALGPCEVTIGVDLKNTKNDGTHTVYLNELYATIMSSGFKQKYGIV